MHILYQDQRKYNKETETQSTIGTCHIAKDRKGIVICVAKTELTELPYVFNISCYTTFYFDLR